jgi:hypothetical protein
VKKLEYFIHFWVLPWVDFEGGTWKDHAHSWLKNWTFGYIHLQLESRKVISGRSESYLSG